MSMSPCTARGWLTHRGGEGLGIHILSKVSTVSSLPSPPPLFPSPGSLPSHLSPRDTLIHRHIKARLCGANMPALPKCKWLSCSPQITTSGIRA